MRRFMLFLLILPVGVLAQRKIYKVEPGERAYDAIPRHAMYSYPDFIEGRVLLRDGSIATPKLNYNCLFGEMQFIDPKGDTLSLDDEKNISLITTSTDTFYFDQGFIELVNNYGKIKLGRKRLMGIANKEKIGALGLTGTGEIKTYTSMTGKQNLKDLVAKEVMYFTVNTTYYFGDKFNHFAPANKKTLLKYFPDQEKQITEYFKNNKVGFNDEDDLKKLLTAVLSF